MVPQISLKRTLPSSFKDESMRKKKKKRGFVPMQPEPGPSKTITPGISNILQYFYILLETMNDNHYIFYLT